MDLSEKLPSMTDIELQNLHSNAERIVLSGKPKQSEQAAHLLPLIKSEQESRAAQKPAPVRRTPVRKKAS
jgi:hypothetical protein